MAKALEDIRILDFTRMYGGPLGTMMLAELGADVIKVEVPVGGDAIRTTAPLTEGQESYRFVALNRGKRGITLNLNSAEGQKICMELVGKCDVLIENFTPGVMEGYGLSYEELKRYNPCLIYVSISGFGCTGPYRNRIAFDTIIQAMGGLISINGFPDSPPIKVGPAIADYLGGIFANIAILAALQYRSKTKQGQFVDISMQDCIWYITAIQFLPLYILTGKEPPRLGNRQIEVTPFSIYKAKDGKYFTIGCFEPWLWGNLCKLVGREDLIPKHFGSFEEQQESYRALSEVFATKDREEWLKKLDEADVCVAPVYNFEEMFADPHYRNHKVVVEMKHPKLGKVKMLNTPFKFSDTPAEVRTRPPLWAEHTREVLGELLGYSKRMIDRLMKDEVIE